MMMNTQGSPAVVTVTSKKRRLAAKEMAFKQEEGREFQLVKVFPQLRYQQLIGFGGAVTETVASLYWKLSEFQRRVFLEEHFSSDGSAYKLVRVPIQSCDFGQGVNAYVRHAWSDTDKQFDLSHDEAEIIPMLQDIARYNPQVEFMATPWSPPAFMKTNHLMRFGGNLKPKYEDDWAAIIARYVHELRERDVPVTRLTVQNEPCATQVWESCVMDAEQELRLASKIRTALNEYGLEDVKILGWDHNKERLIDRISASRRALGDGENPLDGWAFHWYTGDHFSALDAATRCWDLGELIMAEGCEAFSKNAEDRYAHAEHYAHDILGDLNAGANGWIDWNMMLDEAGGPTYVHNYCSAPAEARGDKMRLLPSAVFIRHFSHYIKPGATRMLVSSYDQRLEATAWRNPDGQHVCVILNRNDWEIPFALYEEGQLLDLLSEPHSVTTVTW